MAGINQSVDYDSAEIIVLEYEKVLKKEEDEKKYSVTLKIPALNDNKMHSN